MQDCFDTFQAFGLDYLGPERDWPLSEAERIWEMLWLYGIIIDDDLKTERLAGYWNPEGSLISRADYYVPDDEDTEYPIISLDQPPMEAVAWDAKAL